MRTDGEAPDCSTVIDWSSMLTPPPSAANAGIEPRASASVAREDAEPI
jgi:hypothetical protein